MPNANVKLVGLNAAAAGAEHAFANTAAANGVGKPLEISGANLMYEGARVKSWCFAYAKYLSMATDEVSSC